MSWASESARRQPTLPVGMTVWIDFWQMQCCGKPFALGTQVAWTLRALERDWIGEVLGPDAPLTADATEEHHGGVDGDTEPTRGTVRRILAVHCRFAARPDSGSLTAYPVPGSGIWTDLKSADGWTADRGDQRFLGYLARLADVVIGDVR
jgi:hypothetical protein